MSRLKALAGGFGRVYLKKEGGHIHPDDPMFWRNKDINDEEYLKQLQAYLDDTNDEEGAASCDRSHLVEKLV